MPQVTPDERALLWLERWKMCREHYRPLHELMAKERRFALRLEHYRRQNNQPDDPALVQFVGRELFGKVRRIVADVMASLPGEVSAIPVNETDDDRYTAQDAKWAVEMDVQDPKKGFEIYLERAVLGAAVAREWWMRTDWEASCGEYGELLFGNATPNKVMLCPPFQDVWDYRLPWLIDEQEVDIAQARAMFGEDLQPDGLSADDAATSMVVDDQGRVSFGGSSEPAPGGGKMGRKTLLYCWSQFDYSKLETKNTRKLRDDQRYLWCQSCDAKTPPMPGLPPVGDEPCPMCEIEGQGQQPMVRVDEEELTREELAYKRGKRLDIVDALSGKTLKSTGWPAPNGGFPFCKIVRYEDMTDTSGVSETKLDAPLQVISNALMQKMYVKAFMAPNVIVSGSKLQNAEGDPFTLTNDPWQIAFPEDPTYTNSLQHFKADPVSQGEVTIWNQVQGAFRADMGVTDLGLAQQDPKSVPVGTIERLVESGSVPTDHWIKRIRYVLSPFLNTISEYQRVFWTKERWIRYKGPTGEQSFKRLLGANIPGADFRLVSDKTHDILEFKKAQTILQWIQIQEPWRTLLAPKMGIEPEFVDALRQAEQETEDETDVQIVGTLAQHAGLDPNQFVQAFVSMKQQAQQQGSPNGATGAPQGMNGATAGQSMPMVR